MELVPECKVLRPVEFPGREGQPGHGMRDDRIAAIVETADTPEPGQLQVDVGIQDGGELGPGAEQVFAPVAAEQIGVQEDPFQRHEGIHGTLVRGSLVIESPPEVGDACIATERDHAIGIGVAAFAAEQEGTDGCRNHVGYHGVVAGVEMGEVIFRLVAVVDQPGAHQLEQGVIGSGWESFAAQADRQSGEHVGEIGGGSPCRPQFPVERFGGIGIDTDQLANLPGHVRSGCGIAGDGVHESGFQNGGGEKVAVAPPVAGQLVGGPVLFGRIVYPLDHFGKRLLERGAVHFLPQVVEVGSDQQSVRSGSRHDHGHWVIPFNILKPFRTPSLFRLSCGGRNGTVCPRVDQRQRNASSKGVNDYEAISTAVLWSRVLSRGLAFGAGGCRHPHHAGDRHELHADR